MNDRGDRLDRICLRDLRVSCVIGIEAEERQARQEVVINITMEADLRKACFSDRIGDTVDYQATEARVIAIVKASSCALVEHLAERVAQTCLSDGLVQRVTVTVDKPGALDATRSVAIEITRERKRPGV